MLFKKAKKKGGLMWGREGKLGRED